MVIRILFFCIYDYSYIVFYYINYRKIYFNFVLKKIYIYFVEMVRLVWILVFVSLVGRVFD